MKNVLRRGSALILTLFLLISIASAAGVGDALGGALDRTAAWVLSAVPSPQVGSIGGEWAVLGLARSGTPVPEDYYREYCSAAEAYVKGRQGILHDRKYTEYSRMIVALTAVGKDARAVAGYDLTAPLNDFDKTVWQGNNGPAWALIALDCGQYPDQSVRQRYVEYLLSRQNRDGGWSLNGSGSEVSDPDLTGMVLQALSRYTEQAAVSESVQKALTYAETAPLTTSESVDQIIVGLCELGISPEEDRFSREGKTLTEILLTYARPDGGFAHTPDAAGSDPMSTEQALYTLAAVKRLQDGQTSLYRMSDVEQMPESVGEEGVSGICVPPVNLPGTTFSDVKGHPEQKAIEALAARGIINGKSAGFFDPDAHMTRAEFAAIVVRALGLTPSADDAFTDVEKGAWYAPYVGTAYRHGIVGGVGGGKFLPQGTITRQEAAVMVARAAGLCGIRKTYTAAGIRDVLAQFGDYVQSADWARDSLALCYDEGILSQTDLYIRPATTIRRCEVAAMLYRLLDRANLLNEE